MESEYQALAKAKVYADDQWFDYTRMSHTYQEDNPVSYWSIFLTELRNQGYEIDEIPPKLERRWAPN